MFFDVVSEFAAQSRTADAAAVVRRFGAPPGVAVLGRRGVGRGAVAAALTGAGVPVAPDAAGADVVVLVIAETLKPEEQAQLSTGVDVVVLNKADLTGADPGGPLAAAERRAAELARTAGVPVVPMVAHLATAGLDDDEIAALRALIAAPADMTSTDAFVASEHPLPPELRQRLLEQLDRFGLAHAVLALAHGATRATLLQQLRALSRLDRVTERIAAASAPLRYRRVLAALHELRTLTAQSGDDRLDAFLNSDEVVIAVMAAAVDVVQASGAVVDRGDDAEAHARRAVHWRTVAHGPVDPIHRSCAADISRGSLRLLGRLR